MKEIDRPTVRDAAMTEADRVLSRGLANKLRVKLQREAALCVEAAVLSADLKMTVSRDDRPHKTFVQGFGAAIEMMETVHTTNELAEFVENLKRQLDTD